MASCVQDGGILDTRLLIAESVFNLRIPIDGGYILFNPASRNAVFLDDQVELLSHVDLLTDRGFLVNQEVSIEEEYRIVWEAINRPSDCLYAVFTATTLCDLHCAYCFENRQQRTSMTPGVLEASLQWIGRELSRMDYSSLYLAIFGGEPLLVPSHVREILSAARKLCDQANVHLHPILLTTNGLVASKRLLEELQGMGLAHVQISFDGDREMTNKRRRLADAKDVSDVYASTLARLPLLSKLFGITVKVNFDPNTVDSVARLFDDLVSFPGINLDRVRIKPETIMVSGPINALTQGLLFHPAEQALAAAYEEVISQARDHGLAIDLSAVFNTPCMAHKNSSVLIEPDGTLRSCISAFGEEAFGVGDVFDGFRHTNNSPRLQIQDAFRDCIDEQCAYFPLCAGGCPYEKLMRGYSTARKLCRKAYFQGILPLYVQMQWDQAKHHTFLTSPIG